MARGLGGLSVPKWSEALRDVMPAPLTAVAKQTVREYGRATSSSRLLPDYVIAGTKKGATTTLANWLVAHPGVLRMYPQFQRAKSPHYFETPRYAHGERWYRSHFPTRRQQDQQAHELGYRPLVGESSPFLMLHPRGAQRLARLVPNIKVILVLRDPTTRAFSHFRDQVARGFEGLVTFESALAAEEQRLSGLDTAPLDDPGFEHADFDDPGYQCFQLEHHGYRAAGRYAPQIQRWLRWFDRRQILVVRSEALHDSAEAVFHEITRFLDLPDHPVSLRSYNVRPPSHRLTPETESRLREYFAPHNAELAELLGTTPWWPGPHDPAFAESSVAVTTPSGGGCPSPLDA